MQNSPPSVPDIYYDAQRVVVRGTLADLKKVPASGRRLISILTDDIGLSPLMLSNSHFRYAYDAAQQEYLETMGEGREILLPNVLTRLERIYRHNGHENDASILVAGWKAKIDDLTPEAVDGDPIQCAKVLRDNQVREKVRERLTDFGRKIHHSTNPDVEIADFVAFLNSLESQRGHAIDLDSVIESAQKGYSNPESSGYARLDGRERFGPLAVKGHHTGGYLPGRLIVVTGPPGAGKTTLGINLVARRTEMRLPSVFHSFEMEKDTLYRSLICSIAKTTPDRAFLPLDKIADENERKALEDARTLIRLFVRVYDEPTNMAGMARRFRRHQVEFKGDLVLHALDHLWAFVRDQGKMWEQFVTLGSEFKSLAKNYGSCIVLFSHATKTMEEELKRNNRVTGTGDVYGGQAIRQWADCFMMVGRHNSFPCATVIQTFKNRQGTGWSDDWFVLQYDPTHDYLTDEILADDNPQILPQPLDL